MHSWQTYPAVIVAYTSCQLYDNVLDFIFIFATADRIDLNP